VNYRHITHYASHSHYIHTGISTVHRAHAHTHTPTPPGRSNHRKGTTRGDIPQRELLSEVARCSAPPGRCQPTRLEGEGASRASSNIEQQRDSQLGAWLPEERTAPDMEAPASRPLAQESYIKATGSPSRCTSPESWHCQSSSRGPCSSGWRRPCPARCR